jgi:predicted RNase H-like nuclease (RuvC/YqgF family)
MEEEASAELEHKQWCDKELKLTGEDKDKYQSEVETKTAEKESLEAELAENKSEIKRLQGELAELAKEVAESTKERTEQKKVNEVTIAEAKAAQEATAKAIEVLEAFYSQTKGGEALLQQDPEIASYSGMGGASGGVIGLIETIQSDFAQLESDTTADESAAAAEYAGFMKVSKKSKETKEETVHQTTLKNTSLEAQIRRVAKSLATSQEQLDAVQSYWSELQPMCIVKHVSYEERVKQREEEIQALKDAYQVLADQSGEV